MAEEGEILNMTEAVIWLMEECQQEGDSDDAVLDLLEDFCRKSRSGQIGGDPSNIN